MAARRGVALKAISHPYPHPHVSLLSGSDSHINILRRTSIRCCSSSNNNNNNNNNKKKGTESENNLILKTAWYGSELLGIAASFFRPTSTTTTTTSFQNNIQIQGDIIERGVIVEAIKRDFESSYFVTGCVTVDAYEDDCEFADPAGSFKGVSRFKRNCSNFGSLIHKSNMNLTKWEDFQDKGIGHWRFTCIMAFPWRPILSATGYTEYYLSKQSGKVCRHVEHWNVPKMALFKQLLKPSNKRT